jgi:hypothetical protein
MDHRDKLAAERKSPTFRINTVIQGPPVTDGTKLLRELVACLDGIKPVADLMQADVADVARWTRVGLPTALGELVYRLHREHQSMPGRSQSPGYSTEMAFSLVL